MLLHLSSVPSRSSISELGYPSILSSGELDHCLKGSPSPRYSLSLFGLLLMDRPVYAPEYRPEQGNLRTRGLQAKHDYPTARHFGYNKTLE